MLDMKRVPYLSENHMERKAISLLDKVSRHLNKEIKPPIIVEDIAQKVFKISFGLFDAEKEYGIPDILGCLSVDGDKPMISVNDKLDVNHGRYHFTVAHELGHWALHLPLYKAKRQQTDLFGNTGPETIIMCREDSVERNSFIRGEYQANFFGAAFLIPLSCLKETMQHLYGMTSVNINGDELPERFQHFKDTSYRLDMIVNEILENGGFSNVSKTAMRIRLDKAGLVKTDKQEQGLFSQS